MTMKKIFLLFICSFLLSSTFSVEGMVCGVGCVNKIKIAINSLDGVEVCEVDFNAGTMKVDYDKSKLNDKVIISHLTTNTSFKFSLLADIPSKDITTCSKSCCPEKKKTSFLKKLFNWF